jgi:hypothetical protein
VAGTGLIWLRIETAVFCECGTEPSGSTNRAEFLDYLRTCWHIGKDCAP